MRILFNNIQVKTENIRTYSTETADVKKIEDRVLKVIAAYDKITADKVTELHIFYRILFCRV